MVVPVYNEEKDLEPCVLRLHDHLARTFPYAFRITVADNASTDRTPEVARRLARTLPGVRSYRLEEKGRGRALRTVWSHSDAPVLAYMDVDLSTDLNALLPLVAPLISGHSDLAIGSRLARSSRVVRGTKREFISRAYNIILRSSLAARFSDAQCGFKAIRRDVAQRLLPMVEDTGWFFDTELLVLAERAGLRIHEVPVDWVDDPDSTVHIVRTATEDLKGVWRVGRALAVGALPLDRLARPFGDDPRDRGIGGVPRGLARQLVGFCVVGALSTLLYLALYSLFRLGVGPQLSNGGALLVSAFANTAANRRLTFGVRGRGGAVRHQAQGLVVFAIGLALTSGSLAALGAASGSPSHGTELAVLIAANLAATVLRFLLFRAWVFPDRDRGGDAGGDRGGDAGGPVHAPPPRPSAERADGTHTEPARRHPPRTEERPMTTLDHLPAPPQSAAGHPRPGLSLVRRAWRGRPEDPSWARPAFLCMLLAITAAYLWNLTASGYANSFYSAAAQAYSQSWKAFFFGSLDSANAITVDKPPATLWPMALSVRVFGLGSWAILFPQVLMGVATAGVLYASVRRRFSAAAGLITMAVFALTPVAALMFRFNNPDALLALLMTATVYCVLRAMEDGRTKWLVWAGVAVGLAFLSKTLQAFLILPPLAVLYAVFAPVSVRRRFGQLGLSALSMLVAGGWWVAIVELWPASSRPYIGGSQNNSFLELTFGYNGLGRINGDETGSVGGGGGPGGGAGGQWGETGIGRMFNSEIGSQISWLLPAALILLVAGVWLTWRAKRTDLVRAAFLAWGSSLLMTAGVFSLMAGIFHQYYTVALVPYIAALIGMGVSVLWEERSRWWAGATLALTVAVTAWWAYVLLGRTPDYLPWLRTAVLVAGLLGAVGLLLAARLGRQLTLVAVGLGFAASLAGPVAYTLNTLNTGHQGSIVTAGPSMRRDGRIRRRRPGRTGRRHAAPDRQPTGHGHGHGRGHGHAAHGRPAGPGPGPGPTPARHLATGPAARSAARRYARYARRGGALPRSRRPWRWRRHGRAAQRRVRRRGGQEAADGGRRRLHLERRGHRLAERRQLPARHR